MKRPWFNRKFMNENAVVRKKVLSICSWYPNRVNTTLGNFVQKHNEAIALYNDVVVISIFPDDTIAKTELQISERDHLTEITVYYPQNNKKKNPVFKLVQLYRHWKAFQQGYKICKNKFGKPDIVHLNIVYPLGIYASWLKRRKKIPYVITENSSGFHIGTEHSYPDSVLKICKSILRNASYILPVSSNLKQHLEKLAPDNNFRIISNVVDENKFFLSAKEISNNCKLIHISSGVDSIKNLSGMIRVMNEIRKERSDIHLNIVSDGDINYAKNLASELGCNELISFHSTKTTEEIATMLRQSDALLMFSNYENFPCVIAESFMTGIPVISSNVNGIPEHVNVLNGYLVNPRDESALKDAILNFSKNKEAFDSQRIRQYAMDHFSYSSVGMYFNSVYDEVLKLSKG